MCPLRKLLLVALSAGALCAMQACASETELNPQPLPPGGEPVGAPERAEDPAENDNSTGGSGAAPSADASVEGGDASDASDAGGG